MPQQQPLSCMGRIRHVASIYRSLAAFATNLKNSACSVKQLSHHVRMTRPLKNDLKVTLWVIKPAAECCTSFDQFLKPIDVSDTTLFTDAALNVGLRGIFRSRALVQK